MRVTSQPGVEPWSSEAVPSGPGSGTFATNTLHGQTGPDQELIPSNAVKVQVLVAIPEDTRTRVTWSRISDLTPPDTTLQQVGDR